VTGSLSASQLIGALPDVCLSSNVALLKGNQSFNGANRFDNQANTFSGNGTALTDLSADHLTSGTIADERLSPNVARLNRSQTSSATKTEARACGWKGPVLIIGCY